MEQLLTTHVYKSHLLQIVQIGYAACKRNSERAAILGI